jgi:hypothetical protein
MYNVSSVRIAEKFVINLSLLILKACFILSGSQKIGELNFRSQQCNGELKFSAGQNACINTALALVSTAFQLRF